MHKNKYNCEYLLKCKQKNQNSQLKEIIIPDSSVFPPPLFSQHQILASQYAIAFLEDSVNSTVLKKKKNFPTPIMFAAYQKLVNQEQYGNAISILENLRSSSNYSKHIILSNIAQLYKKTHNESKAIFFLQILLKQRGGNYETGYYEYIKSLVNEKRMVEAQDLLKKTLQKNTESKPLLQSLYLSFLEKKQNSQIIQQLHRIFHNRKLSLITTYNLAVLLQKIDIHKSLQLFQKINGKVKNQDICVAIKLNIVKLKDKIWNEKKVKFQNQNEYYEHVAELKEFLNQQHQIYRQIFHRNLSQKGNKIVILKIEGIKKEKRYIDEKLKKDSKKISVKNDEKKNLPLKQLMNKKNKKDQNNSYVLKLQSENSERQSERVGYKHILKQKENSLSYKNKGNEGKEQKRKKEEELQFLINKQKQLNRFFQRIRVYKKDDKYDVQLIDKSILGNVPKTKQPLNEEIQKQFEAKVKQYELLHQGKTDEILNCFLNEYISTEIKKDQRKDDKRKSERKFILNSSNKDQIKQSNKSYQKIRDQYRICKSSEKKINKSSRRIQLLSSKRILDTLRESPRQCSMKYLNIDPRKNEKKRSSFMQKEKEKQKQKFSQMLEAGKKFEDLGQMQKAHNHFAMMYKKFKQEEEKQIILLKIANNFELQEFDEEAQKTYIKCTKFNIAQAFFRLGNLQIKNGRIESGVENLEKANCLDRENIEIQMKLVYGYSLIQQTASRALSLANTILKRNPDSLQALIMTSKVLQKQGKAKQALQIALAISKIRNSPTLDHYVGLLYLHDSNVSEAFKYFQKALKYKPDHIPSLIQVATILSDVKPFEAITILKKVLQINPQNQLAWTRLGKIYEMEEESYQNAIKAYKKSLQIEPNYESYIKIGDCFYRQYYYGQATHNYKQALNLKKTPGVFVKLALVYEKQSNFKKAIDSYSSAIELIPDDNGHYFQKKKYLFEIGRISLVLQEYDTAQTYLMEVSQMEESLQVFKMLGQAYYGKNEYSQALQCYLQALNLLPKDDIELLQNIASCFDKMEEFMASKQIYERILREDPKNVSCLNNLGNILLMDGHTNEAIYYFQQMLNQVPLNIDRRLRVGDIYATIGDWSKVEEHLLICYRQKQNDIRVIERLLNLYKQKRETKLIIKFEKKMNFLKQSKRN